RIGMARAKRAYARSWSAVQALTRIVREDRIPCGLAERRSLYLAGDEYGHRALKAEAEARAAMGLPSEYLDGATLRDRFGLDRTGASPSQGSAAADPARLAAGLLRRAAADGARIFAPAEVIEALSDPGGVTLATDTGHAVRARKVVFCCGYE